IRYLNIADPDVRKNLRERGELWRMTPDPITKKEMAAFIENARLAMDGQAIYRYNRNTGVRLVTPAAFRSLGTLPEAGLRAHLVEIQTLLRRRNRAGRPEAAFFPPDCAFTLPDADFAKLPDIRAAHKDLSDALLNAAGPAFREDDPSDPAWSHAMCRALSAEINATIATDEIFKELPQEFFRKIHWLPGADFDGHVMRFDPVYHEPAAAAPGLRDEHARAILQNYASEHRDIAYINIGRIEVSLSISRPRHDHDDTVYIIEIKHKGDRYTLRHLRFNKWGVAERLAADTALSFERAVFESDEYTEFILDRRLGCLQFGMNLPANFAVCRIRSTYQGPVEQYRGRIYWDTFTTRNFVPGLATDKIPAHHYANPAFTAALARLLGNAAALNIVIGRASFPDGKNPQVPFFDDGDEIVQLDANGLPKTLAITDPSGAFAHYAPALCDIAHRYADPVNDRLKFPMDHRAFAETYLEHFTDRLHEIRENYLKNKTAFDTLFKHLPSDSKGNIRYRWDTILQRLREVNVKFLAGRVREGINIPRP
ncbi:MAG: hypothetical protein FWF96_04230, partial [Kiritimatiellaeota bacterium]|nr:hypothetical protein [Kiritimatiellota bacterium]